MSDDLLTDEIPVSSPETTEAMDSDLGDRQREKPIGESL
jgi:hypothetical protein